MKSVGTRNEVLLLQWCMYTVASMSMVMALLLLILSLYQKGGSIHAVCDYLCFLVFIVVAVLTVIAAVNQKISLVWPFIIAIVSYCCFGSKLLIYLKRDNLHKKCQRGVFLDHKLILLDGRQDSMYWWSDFCSSPVKFSFNHIFLFNYTTRSHSSLRMATVYAIPKHGGIYSSSLLQREKTLLSILAD